MFSPICFLSLCQVSLFIQIVLPPIYMKTFLSLTNFQSFLRTDWYCNIILLWEQMSYNNCCSFLYTFINAGTHRNYAKWISFLSLCVTCIFRCYILRSILFSEMLFTLHDKHDKTLILKGTSWCFCVVKIFCRVVRILVWKCFFPQLNKIFWHSQNHWFWECDFTLLTLLLVSWLTNLISGYQAQMFGPFSYLTCLNICSHYLNGNPKIK